MNGIVGQNKDSQISVYKFKKIDFNSLELKIQELGFTRDDEGFHKDETSIYFFEDNSLLRIASNDFDGLHEKTIAALNLEDIYIDLAGIGYGSVYRLTLNEDFSNPINDILNIVPQIQIEDIDSFIEFSVEFSSRDNEDNIIYTNVSALPLDKESQEQHILITIGINKELSDDENINESIEHLKKITENYYEKIVVIERGDD